MTHLIMAGIIVAVSAAIYLLGWHSHGLYTDERAILPERHTHRKGDPLPCAGRLPLERLADPEPLPGEPPIFLFPGEPTRGWAAESAEYELLIQTAEQPASSVEGEPPIDTGELLAITDRVEAWIAQWTAQGNYDRHTIQAGE